MMRKTASLLTDLTKEQFFQPRWAIHAVEAVNPKSLLPERTLKGRTILVTGASRGIGLAIALRAAKDGANVVIAAKSTEENAKLPGTIFSAAKAVDAAGGKGLALPLDVRNEEQMQEVVAATIKAFGGIDVLVNNASAIKLTPTEETTMKSFDLMNTVNARGTYLATKTCLPHLIKSTNPHVLTLSPPLNMDPKWFAPHTAYSIAKFGMSMCVLGHSAEFRKHKIAVNALWPRTVIATAAANAIGGDPLMQVSRKPEIMADAAHFILTRKSDKCTGNFFIDDEVLASEGIQDLHKYSVNPKFPLAPDLFV